MAGPSSAQVLADIRNDALPVVGFKRTLAIHPKIVPGTIPQV